MPERIDLPRLKELLGSGAQLVEVLPHEEYVDQHLPSSLSLPLKELRERAVAALDTTRPVFVYCWDSL